VGPTCRRRFPSPTRHVLSLRSGSHLLAPTHAPRLLDPSRPTVRAHDRAHVVDSTPTTHAKASPAPTRPFLAARTPLLPPPSLVHSQGSSSHLTLRAHKRSPAAVRRGLVLGRRRDLTASVVPVSFASTPATLDAPRFTPPPSISLCPRSSDLHHAAGVPTPLTRSLTSSLPPFKGPEALSRCNQPPMPLISPFLSLGVHDFSSALSYAAAEPSHHGPPPSGESALVSFPQPRSPCRPEPT
jgi:hypothetical protein